MSGILTIVPTPVGNMEDMTMRAIRTLKEADVILAEDTRTSSILLRHFDIHTPMKSFHKYNEHRELQRIIDELESGTNIALISDAGTPGISDPGFLLSRECRRHEIDVRCLPGATAFVPAVVASGLSCERFVFEGFLPLKKGRATRLAELASDPRTCIIYESPKRLPRTLGQLCITFGGDREAAVCREISKLHETIHRGTLDELKKHFDENNPKGEIVIVISGRPDRRQTAQDKNENIIN